MIYDCFPFFNELEILDIRLNTLNNVVDKFVISESTRTHSNESKPLYFHENRNRWEKFEHKIIHVVIDDMPQGEDHWERERYQRNEMIRGLDNIKDGDSVHVSDADEISSPVAILRALKKRSRVRISHVCYYYYFNLVANWDWTHAYVMPWREFKAHHNPTLTHFRHLGCNRKVKGGWHFSYLGGTEQVCKKIKAFAHQEFNTPETLATIKTAIAKKRSFCDLNTEFTSVVNIDGSYPAYVRDNIEKYRKMGYVWEGEKVVPL